MVRSAATKGRIVSIDTGKAARASGVLAVLTHENAPKLPYLNSRSDVVDPETGETLRMLQDDLVHFNGQPIAVVVAETLADILLPKIRTGR
jgi:xanthine dehydrogenase YagR molybdenum-binding subunit